MRRGNENRLLWRFGSLRAELNWTILRRSIKVLLALCIAATVALPIAPGPGVALEAEESVAETEGLEQEADPAAQAIAQAVEAVLASLEVKNTKQLYASDIFAPDDGTAQFIAFDFAHLGLVGGGNTYLKRIDSYITEAYAGEDAGLNKYEPTDWARTAMVVQALGGDPTAIGKGKGGNPANLLNDGIFNWSYTDSIADQGSNALIYALQAIGACNAEPPEDAQYTQKDLLDMLLDCQTADGSFSLVQGSAQGSVDLTGMALAALGPRQGTPEVDAAVEAGVNYLSEQQAEDGTFATSEGTTSESISMAIIGLVACGIDPASDQRFVKNDVSLLDALLSFQREDGMIRHVTDDPATTMPFLATEQALRALIAWEELQAGGDGNVYTIDITLDIPGADGKTANSVSVGAYMASKLSSLGVGVGLGLIVVFLFWSIRKIRRVQRLKKG